MSADPLGLADEPEYRGVDDRDDSFLRMKRTQSAGRERSAPDGPRRWGGALRRVVQTPIAPSREDYARATTVPGRYTPIGFARYESPVVRPADFAYYRMAGWQVAVPRSLPSERVRDLLWRMFYYGPESAGYVRLGDTLVPALLGPGDRMTLAGDTAPEYDAYPLSQ
jgi:hypothetical protein